MKEKQLKMIIENNPMQDDYHTGIRTVEDIKSFEEVLQDKDELIFTPDYTKETADKALKTGKINVYSSKDIVAGSFVTPSKIEAESYAGTGNVKMLEVDIKDVAWIDNLEGQYAPVKDLELNKEIKMAEKNGTYKTYHSNGVLESEKYYKNDKQDGLCRWYHKNGELEREVNFKNGKEDGKLNLYWNNGQLASESYYIDGVKEGEQKTYYETGQLESEISYVNGKFEGLEKAYYPNGQLESEITFKNGEEHGLSKLYREDGSLWVEENRKNGERHGIRKEYEDGKEPRITNWKNGVQIPIDKDLSYEKEKQQLKILNDGYKNISELASFGKINPIQSPEWHQNINDINNNVKNKLEQEGLNDIEEDGKKTKLFDPSKIEGIKSDANTVLEESINFYRNAQKLILLKCFQKELTEFEKVIDEAKDVSLTDYKEKNIKPQIEVIANTQSYIISYPEKEKTDFKIVKTFEEISPALKELTNNLKKEIDVANSITKNVTKSITNSNTLDNPWKKKIEDRKKGKDLDISR